jgi:hypothetical protein
MYTILILMVLCIACAIFTRNRPSDAFDWVGILFKGCAAGFLLGYGIAYLIGGRLPIERQQIFKQQLVSVSTTNSQKGLFILGSGVLGVTQYLNVRVMDSDGGSTHKRFVDDGRISVKEDPALHGTGYWLRVADFSQLKGPLVNWAVPHIEANTRDQLVVPVGSVTHGFTVQ